MTAIFGATTIPELSKEYFKTVDSLDLNVRAKNALAQAGLKTIDALMVAEGKFLINMRNSGEVSLKEVTRALLKTFRTPAWFHEVTHSFHYPEVEWISTEEERALSLQGWNCVAGGYQASEYWMLENAVASLERSGIEYRLYRMGKGIHIFRKGGVVMADEPDI